MPIIVNLEGRHISARDDGSEKIRALWNWAAKGVPEFCRTCSFHMPIDKMAALPSAFSDPLGTFGG